MDESEMLPSLRSRPSFTELTCFLRKLHRPPSDFLNPPRLHIDQHELRWVTSVISNDLMWLNADDRAVVLDLASATLASNCGRFASPSLTRDIVIGNHKDPDREPLKLTIHEPTLVNDALGLKTWSTSFMVAQKLQEILAGHLRKDINAIELGAGTGLLGISVSRLFDINMTLTDYLPEVLSNLRRNVAENNAKCTVELLDWANLAASEVIKNKTFFDLVILSDCNYTEEQPLLVTRALTAISHAGSLVLCAYPERSGNADLVEEFHSRLRGLGIIVLSQGHLYGFEDFDQAKVTAKWLLFRISG